LDEARQHAIQIQARIEALIGSSSASPPPVAVAAASTYGTFPPPAPSALSLLHTHIPVSASNPFSFAPRAPTAEETASAAAQASAEAAATAAFEADWQRLKLLNQREASAREVAALKAAREKAAAKRAEEEAVAAAAKRMADRARAVASAARAIEIDGADTSGSAPGGDGDANDAPMPSTYAAVAAREARGKLLDPRQQKMASVLPARKSDWSLRQQLMAHAAPSPTALRALASKPAATTVSARDARVAAAHMPSQSRWVAKTLLADPQGASAG